MIPRRGDAINRGVSWCHQQPAYRVHVDAPRGAIVDVADVRDAGEVPLLGFLAEAFLHSSLRLSTWFFAIATPMLCISLSADRDSGMATFLRTQTARYGAAIHGVCFQTIP